MKKIVSILLIVLMALSAGTVALAADISNAEYTATVQVTNNGTATTNEAAVFSANTSAYIASGFMAANLSNVAIHNTAGADVAFMPVYGSGNWSVYVPSAGDDTVQNYTLYTGATGGEIRYFPGTPGMTTPDDATLELGDNFTVTLTNTYIDTGTVFGKADAITVTYNATSENVTASAWILSDSFITDTWTDVGTKITVDTVNQRINYEAERSATDTRCYKDLTSTSDTNWELKFSINSTSSPSANALMAIGLFQNAENYNGMAGDGILLRIATATPYIDIVSIIGGAADNNSADINLSDGIVYYVTLTRDTATSATLNVYSDSARTTHIAGSPQSLVINSGIGSLRYLQVTNYNDGADAAYELIGRIDDVSFGKISTTVTGITTGEYDVTVSANTTHLILDVGGTTNSTALGGASIPDNANDYITGAGGSILYMESQEIEVDGVQVQFVEWEYGTTFADQSGNGNDANPSFRTTGTNANLTAALLGFGPLTESTAPAYVISEPAYQFTDNVTITGNFTANATSAGTYPGSQVIVDISEAGETPVTFTTLIIALFLIMTASLCMTYLMRRHATVSVFIQFIIIITGMGIMVAVGALDWWVLILFGMIGIGICMAAGQRGFTGTGITGNNTVGFMAMAFVGLTTINRILEGRFIQSTDVSLIENVLAFRPFNFLGWFTIPVPNISFITSGIPALLDWNYSFFGGNAQIIQYMLYSVTAVMSFVLFVLTFGAVYNMIARLRGG